MRLLPVALVLMAALTPLQAAAAGGGKRADQSAYVYRMLNAPSSSDERAVRTLGLQPRAQQLSDSLFGAISPLLGGTAPSLNFVPTGSPLTTNHLSANLSDKPGAPKGTINMDPYVVSALLVNSAPDHSLTVNQLPHEMAHTRQIIDVLKDVPGREGGAQAFADAVTLAAAQKAGIQYQDGNYDGAYSDFVKAAQAKGRDWVLGGQFGRTAVSWP